MVVYSKRSRDTASLFMVVQVHDTVKDLVTSSLCLQYVQVQNTVFCTCLYREQWEGVTRSFTVSCTYTTMNKEAVSRDLLLYTTMKKRLYHEIFYCIQPRTKRLYHEIFYCIHILHKFILSHMHNPYPYSHLSCLTCISRILHIFIN